MIVRARVLSSAIAALAASVAIVALAIPASAQTELPHQPLADVTTDRITLRGSWPGVIDVPQYMAVTPNAVWIGYHRAGRVDRLDPATNEVIASVAVPVPGCRPGGCLGLNQIVADERNVWVFNDQQSQLVHIDARTNRVVASVATIRSVAEAAVIDGDSLWAALSGSGDIVRISARTHAVTKRVHVRDAPAWPIAIVGGALWAGSYDRSAPPERAAMLHRIDRVRGKVTKNVNGVTGSEGQVVDGDLWLSGCGYVGFPQLITACPALHRVDGRTGALEAEVPVGGLPFMPTRANEHTLVVSVDNGPGTPAWLTAIDTRRNLPTAVYDLPTSDAPAGLAFGHGSLWVTNWSANTVSRVELPES